MNRNTNLKVALVTESLWSMGGANRVLETISEIYPNADIYSLFGNKENISESLRRHNIFFSFLNKFPYISHLYRYTYHLWPLAIESFDFSKYDLVISSSSSVAHGAITPLGCKHIAYIHSPMRYAWDLKDMYVNKKTFFLKRIIVNILISYIRIWDVVASQRPGLLICNSKFVKDRVRKYWDRDVEDILYPPIEKYKGEIQTKRDPYYVSCAPFEPNKRGDFLLECARTLGFNLKIFGIGSQFESMRRRYSKDTNIEFLGSISEEEKWKLLSNARGYIVPGIEDFGISIVEAISCGTPVIAYAGGGSLEIVNNECGVFFNDWKIDSLRESLKEFESRTWDYNIVANESLGFNGREEFKKEFIRILDSDC